MTGAEEPLTADRQSIVTSWVFKPFGVRSRRALLHTTKHQRQIIGLSVVPATIFCVVMYFLLHAFQNEVAEAIYTASDVASIKFVSEWAFALLAIVLLYLGCGFLWAYAVSNNVVGPFDRIIRELDEVIDGGARQPITVRQRDELAQQLLKRVNVLVKNLPGPDSQISAQRRSPASSATTFPTASSDGNPRSTYASV